MPPVGFLMPLFWWCRYTANPIMAVAFVCRGDMVTLWHGVVPPALGDDLLAALPDTGVVGLRQLYETRRQQGRDHLLIRRPAAFSVEGKASQSGVCGAV